MLKTIKRLWKEDEGATMVEYGILVALLSVVAIVTIASVGDYVLGAFSSVETTLESQGVPSGDQTTTSG